MTEPSIIQPKDQKFSRNIKVFVRLRPFNQKEMGDKCCISLVDEKNITIGDTNIKESHNFGFDGIFDSQTSQSEVYDKVGSQLVNEAFKGINGTVFCYGQASSGKTHTCIGPNYRDEHLAGILPRLIKDIFVRIERSPKNIETKMKISMVEIYNQKIKDLLNPSKSNLRIRSNKKGGIFLENVSQKYILMEEEAFSYLNIGTHNRAVTATNMNNHSSRSHMVFIINLHITDIYTGQAKSAKVILVDLAGSEKISKTGAEGKVLEEAKKINTSLTTLGKVINALSDGKSQHVPYRDSKLTRLLQQSLGGNSITNLIINISPSASNQPQTMSSIRFGLRAKTIKNDPIVNKSFTIQQLLHLLKKAQQTIQKQNTIIKDLQNKKRAGGYGSLIPTPKMITMHLIDIDNQQQNSETSINTDESDIDSIRLSDQNSPYKNSTFSFKQQRITHKPKNKLYFTDTNNKFFDFQCQQKNEQFAKNNRQQITFSNNKKQLEFAENQLQNNKSIQYDQLEISQIMLKQNPNINNLPQNYPCADEIKQKINTNIHVIIRTDQVCSTTPVQTILQQNKQNKQNKQNVQNVQKEMKQSNGCKLLQNQNNAQQNLQKIRQNILYLKLRYMQEKQSNTIKSVIIQQKDRAIDQMKNTLCNKLR